MAHYVYILQSIKTGKYYIGSTTDIGKRLKEHNSGKVRSTRKRGPYKVLYQEEKSTKSEAVKREYQIKRYKGGNAFRNLIE